MLTDEQARRGLEVLNERRDDGEYIGMMWSAETERRLGAGEALSAIIEQGLHTAAQWLYQASESLYPTRTQWETFTRLFEATGQDPALYGYKRPIAGLAA
jgi:hypothetical protein